MHKKLHINKYGSPNHNESASQHKRSSPNLGKRISWMKHTQSNTLLHSQNGIDFCTLIDMASGGSFALAS